ncbi:MAG: nuclear transport factor 2 family protein [Alphaproteobacteria bacterium]|nr:nuclear transport factor 2 family protein [Alphaproteobacteria bacterium]
MQLSRRNLAVTGALALGTSRFLLASPAHAEPGDQQAVSQAVEALRKALLEADKAALMQLAAEQLSYGHSDGRVQNKGEFVDGVVNRKGTVKSLTFPDLNIGIAGDAAIARHRYVSSSEADGKTTDVNIGVLAVWQKQDGGWKLLARQGYKLA